MKAYVLVLGASVLSAGLSAMGLSLWTDRASQTDPLTSGSVPVIVPEAPAFQAPPGLQDASPPAIFSVSNFTRKTVCLVERGATLTSRSREFFAPPDCDRVFPGLTKATNWTQNEDGSVTLTNVHGASVLTLVRGRSFSYEAADLSEADIALLMLP